MHSPIDNQLYRYAGIAPKQNAFKFKISPHKQKSIVKFFWVEKWAKWALCLSTLKHNGEFGTVA